MQPGNIPPTWQSNQPQLKNQQNPPPPINFGTRHLLHTMSLQKGHQGSEIGFEHNHVIRS
jgi:hypothetical protein